MAVTFLTGFEAAAAGLDGITFGATPPVYSTAQARTGTTSMRCNGSTVATFIVLPTGSTTGRWVHFGLYIATMPSGPRILHSAGSLTLRSDGLLNYGVSTSVTPMTTGRWYWIGIRHVAGAFSGPWLQIDGTTEITASYTLSSDTNVNFGLVSGDTPVADIYLDDVIIDNAGFLAPSKVIDLLPTADSAIGTGWTLGSGGTSNLWGGVDNQPPTAVADAGTTAQIRNATSNANSNYDATLQTYTVGGAASGATVLAVQPIVATGAPVTTSSKQGTVGVVSNPAITNIALGAGGTAGAFWSGVAAGTYPTGWKVSQGTLTTSPSVTLGTAPVMRVTQVTASTRIAMVSYMALRVAWTPSSATPVTGTGAGSGTASTSSGAGAETFVGTGGGTGTAASASGTGTSLQAFTGTGAGTQVAATALGTGVETISGTGAGTLLPPMADGSGTALLAVTGTGAGSGVAATASGSGDVAALGEITGTGAGEQLAASATGDGLQVYPGGGVQVPQSAYGEGTVEEIVVEPPIGGEGSSLYFPRLRLVIGGAGAGIQAKQSATGKGRVNDDDLVVMAA